MMHFLIILTIIIYATAASHTSRIYGGQNATSGQFPFMVTLNDEDQFCNGVIVAPSWILTPAFCLFYRAPTSEVYVGSHINHVNGTGYRFFERVVHEEYDEQILINDIALIRINTVLQYGDTIQAVELGTAPAPNATCTVMGWGVTETQDYPPLQYVDATVIDLASCQNISANSTNGYYVGPEQVCTQSAAGQGACYSDYGGALICDGKLSGILSYSVGYDCGIGMPDVFTSIATYTDWILSYI